MSAKSKAAFVVLAASDAHESLGRVVNALMGALEYVESGDPVQVVFDGAGTQAAAALAQPAHKYHKLLEKVWQAMFVWLPWSMRGPGLDSSLVNIRLSI